MTPFLQLKSCHGNSTTYSARLQGAFIVTAQPINQKLTILKLNLALINGKVPELYLEYRLLDAQTFIYVSEKAGYSLHSLNKKGLMFKQFMYQFSALQHKHKPLYKLVSWEWLKAIFFKFGMHSPFTGQHLPKKKFSLEQKS